LAEILPMVRLQAIAGARTYCALAAALWTGALLFGCAALPWHDKPAQKYETVATNKRRDTKTAQIKHAEALALLDKDREKHLSKAEKLLNEALVADVRYGPAHNSLGMVYYLQNKLYLAAWEFEYAAKLMPDHAQPYNNLGLVYEQAGKYEEAISYYAMALSRDENDPQVTGNLVRARLAMGDKGGDVKEMISHLALNHPDPGWQEWARDQVGLAKFDESGMNLERSWDLPAGAPEVLPAPIRDRPDVPKGPELTLPESINPLEGESS